jgi:ABC-type transporter Mla subunit MlaD
MAGTMTKAVEGMKQELGAISAEMQRTVQAITGQVGVAQAETDKKLTTTLEKIDTSLSGLLTEIKSTQNQLVENTTTAQTAATTAMQNAATDITDGIEKTIAKLVTTAEKMHQSVNTLSGATSENIQQMNSGAAAINAAVTNFAKAGDAASGVLKQTGDVGKRLGEASNILETTADKLKNASETIKFVAGDYANQKTTIIEALNQLNEAIGRAKDEASLSEGILQRLQGSANKLQEAHSDIDDYLQKVSGVLQEANETFRGNLITNNTTFQECVSNTMKEVNSNFHEELTSSTKLLNSAIQELETTLTAAGATRPSRNI